MRIFIIENDLVRINNFRKALASRAHEITVAGWIEGYKGATQLHKPPYDLYLIDPTIGGPASVGWTSKKMGSASRWAIYEVYNMLPHTNNGPWIITHSMDFLGNKEFVDYFTRGGWKTVMQEPYGDSLLRRLSGLELTPQNQDYREKYLAKKKRRGNLEAPDGPGVNLDALLDGVDEDLGGEEDEAPLEG